MRKHRYIALTALFALVVSACSSSTPSSAPAATTAPAASATTAASTEPQRVRRSRFPERGRRSRRIRPKRSSRASRPTPRSRFWTFYLSPTFDHYIKDTIARFEATYPGVKVNWEDHQATFQDDLNNAFAAGNAPDVINLSVSEGWVSRLRHEGPAPRPRRQRSRQAVQDIYFPGLWKEQLVDGKNFQFPWYQGINVELINKQIYDDGPASSVADFPKTIDGLPALCTDHQGQDQAPSATSA